MQIKRNQKERALVLIAGNGAAMFQFLSIAIARYEERVGDILITPALLALLPGAGVYLAFLALGGAGSEDEKTGRRVEHFLMHSFLAVSLTVLLSIGHFVSEVFAPNLTRP